MGLAGAWGWWLVVGKVGSGCWPWWLLVLVLG